MDVDRILPQLLVGSCPWDRADIESLEADFGVTAVLNLQTADDFAYWGIDWPNMEAAYRASQIETRRVPVPDFNPEDLRQKLPECVQALDELLHRPYGLRALQRRREPLAERGDRLSLLDCPDGACRGGRLCAPAASLRPVCGRDSTGHRRAGERTAPLNGLPRLSPGVHGDPWPARYNCFGADGKPTIAENEEEKP